MMLAILPQFDPKRLFRRLARLRRRIWLVAGMCGLFAVLAVLAGGIAILGFLDWRFHLPGLVRALGLVGTLSAAGYLAIRLLIQPFRVPADNLRLALRVEANHPELNDALASAVQFMELPADDESSSPLLRRVAIKRALRLADEYNFNELISAGGA